MALLLVQQPETLFGCLDTLAEFVDVSHLAGDPLTFDPPRLAAKGKLFTNGNPLFTIGVKHRAAMPQRLSSALRSFAACRRGRPARPRSVSIPRGGAGPDRKSTRLNSSH